MKHIPNILSLFRIILVPFFAYYYLTSPLEAQTIAITIFIVAGLTDLLDGHIARRYDLISKLGTLLDPLADKMMLLTVLMCMSIRGVLPLWITLLMITKESFLVISSAVLYLKHEKLAIPSNIFGKLATVSFSLAVLLLLFLPGNHYLIIIVIVSMILKLVALFSYIYTYKKN